MNEKIRSIQTIYPARETFDGAGVRIFRSIGSPGLNHVDPFLLLDEFISDNPDDYIAGFPAHPHRGFETVTYMIHGRIRHEDSTGNTGELGPGGVQWMTAGRGVVHSEMPLQENGLMHGFQLWINLPAAQKMMPPRYQNIESSAIPVMTNNDCEIKIIAGTLDAISGPVNGVITDPLYLDVNLSPHAEFQFPEASAHTLLAYVFDGELDFGSGWIKKGNVVVFSGEGKLRSVSGKSGGRFLLLGAKPLNEPIFRSGPFVMNTREEIEKAYQDFR